MEQTRTTGGSRVESWQPQPRSQSDRRTVTVIRNDCGEKMMSDAARKACIALDCSDENDPDRKQDLATSLKASFDRDYDGTWNSVVGSDFGASITHELSRIIFFAIEAEPFREGQSIYILLFQQTEAGRPGSPPGSSGGGCSEEASTNAAATSSTPFQQHQPQHLHHQHQRPPEQAAQEQYRPLPQEGHQMHPAQHQQQPPQPYEAPEQRSSHGSSSSSSSSGGGGGGGGGGGSGDRPFLSRAPETEGHNRSGY